MGNENEEQGTKVLCNILIGFQLTDLAQQCAEYYAEINRVDHTCPFKETLGENLGWERRSDGPPPAARMIPTSINDWYAEIKDYNFDDPASALRNITGHFTQLVWRSSERVGMATASSPLTNITYLAALYDPPGNIAVKGEGVDRYKLYLANVLKPVE